MEKLLLSTVFKNPDWEPLFTIDFKCFADEPKIACFFPHGLEPDYLSTSIESFRASVFGGPTERAVACVRNDHTNKILAFISCRVYRGKLGIVNEPFVQPPPPMQLPGLEDPGTRKYWEWFWTEMRTQVRDVDELHEPVVIIQVLATDPEWRRMGAATLLLDWLFTFAAQEGLRVAVQPGWLALKTGFYQKFGFRICRELTIIDKEKFPERGGIYAPVMIRDSVR